MRRLDWLIAAGGGLALVGLAIADVDRPYLVVGLVALLYVLARAGTGRWAGVVLDWLPVLVITAGYDLVRSFAPDLLPRAVTAPQRDFDEILFGQTPTVLLQRELVDGSTPHWWDYGVWAFYLSHFVVTPAIALWLYLRHRAWFGRYARLILVLSLAGFVTYFLVPAVPPWMASREGALPHTIRIVHAVWSDLGFDSIAQVFAGDAKVANPVAALPSLHAAWPFAALLYLWSRIPRWRVPLVAYNALMALVLMYGSEHYLSDILLGWTYASVAFVVVDRVANRRVDRRVDGRTSESSPPPQPGGDQLPSTAASSTAS